VNLRLCAGVSVLLFLGALGAQDVSAAASTTFVASYGSDSNGYTNCARSSPCRTFAGALAVTSAGGEVIVLDSEEYGPVQIMQSVSIIAPEGVYAGVQVINGNGIGIGNGSGSLSVTLRGLTFEGPGPSGSHTGATGLSVGNFTGSVVVQKCNFRGFFPSPTGTVGGGTAIYITGNGAGMGRIQAQIIDSVIQDSMAGITIIRGVTASISHVKLLNLTSSGVRLEDQGSAETDVSVSDTEWSAPSLSGGTAFEVATYSMSAQLYIDHTVITGGGKGVYALSSGGLAYVTVTDSVVSKAGVALSTAGVAAEITFSGSTINANSCGASNAAGGTLISTGNNLFIGNGSNVAGSLSRVGTL
jgi:Periplasmic copper-binding protein (NosD)